MSSSIAKASLMALFVAGFYAVPLSVPVCAHGDGPVRVLQFPSKQAFGTIRFHKSHRAPIAAKGRVEVPANSIIELRVAYDSTHDLSPLKSLPADAIQKLDMNSLEVEDEQLQNLENMTGLQELNLEDTDIGDKGLRWLHKLNNLKLLRLKSTLVTGKGLVYLRPLTSLTNLSLSSTAIRDEGLQELLALKKLTALSLSRSQITDRAMKMLAPLSQLRKLEIEFNQVSDAGIASLVGMKNLRELFLSDNRVTVGSIKYLKQLPALELLVYSSKNFNSKDAEKLQNALPHCRVEEYVKNRKVQLMLFEPLH